MTALPKLLARSLRSLRWMRPGFPAALLLVASACGPLPGSGPSSAALTVSQPVDTLDVSVSSTVELEPVADAYVCAGSPDKYQNFGTSPELMVTHEAFRYAPPLYESYLRFDLSALPAQARVTSVKLQGTAFRASATFGPTVDIRLVADDSWSETGITYVNKPAPSTWLGAWNGSRIGLAVSMDPALATAVQNELGGDKKLSVWLGTSGVWNSYHSREVADAAKRPKLIVTYELESEPCTVEPGAPTLTLNGSSQMTLECGLSTWTDPSATAADACGPLEVHRYNSGSDAYGPGPNTRAEGSYTVQYTAWNAGGSVSVFRTVTVNDTTAPTLRLRGAAQLTHTCGSQFVDPGVDALDACYGDVSSTVQVTGSVNGWAPGTYTLRYDVTDSGGNSATPVTRTVNVVNCPW
jgi:hypothetical protein